MSEQLFNNAKSERPDTDAKWPAEKWINAGGMKLESLYSFRKLYQDKIFCDVGFARGNILHAVYPFVESMVGYETEHAVGKVGYETTNELLFLKSQKEKNVNLIYKRFEKSQDLELVKSIDFFYFALGVEHFVNMNVGEIFKVNPKAIILHHFLMNDQTLSSWRRTREFTNITRPFNYFSHVLDSIPTNEVHRFAIGESSSACGQDPRIIIKQDDWFTILYCGEQVITESIKKDIADQFQKQESTQYIEFIQVP